MAKVTGLAELRAAAKSLPAQMRQALVERFHRVGAELVAAIKARCPSVSGALRNSVRYEVKDEDGQVKLCIFIGDDLAYYAGFVEFGSSHAPAHPFVRPVVYGRRSGLAKDMEVVIEEVLTREAGVDGPNVRGIGVGA